MSARCLSRLTCAHLMPIRARLLFAFRSPDSFRYFGGGDDYRCKPKADVSSSCNRNHSSDVFSTCNANRSLSSSSPGPHTRPTSEKMWSSGREFARTRSIQHSSIAVASESVHRAPADRTERTLRNFGMEMQQIDTVVSRIQSGPFSDFVLNEK